MLVGEKKVELRRRALRIPVGTRIWIYSKAPYAAVAAVDEGAPSLRSSQGWVPRTHDLEVCGPHPFAQTAKGWGTRQAAEDGHLEVYTSSITLSECAHLKDNSDPSHLKVVMDEKAQEFFKNLLSSGTLIKLVQDSIFVAEQARDLMWKHGIVLKGMDAIHVASALDAGCKEFLTWDMDMGNQKTAQKIIKLQELGMKVIQPCQSTLLPPQYSQERLDYKQRNN
jgi:predicted nucleic acid-binding protein